MPALSFLLNPKVIIGLLIAGLVAFGWYKWEHAQSEIREANNALKIEQQNVSQLRANEVVIRQVNEENQKTIDQLQEEKAQAAKSVAALRASVQSTNKQLDETKQKLAAITTPAVPLSPYLIEAIDSIQRIRGLGAPVAPATAASAPTSAPVPPVAAPAATSIAPASAAPASKQIKKVSL